MSEHQGVHYVHAPDLAGWMTKSRNEGLMWTTGDVVAFLDDDVVVHSHWSAALLKCYAETDCDAAVGRTINRQPGEEHYDLPIGDLTDAGELTDGFAAQTDGRRVVVHGIGANMSFTRDILITLGGFRDDYPGTALREDTDIFLRIARLGGKAVYDPDAAVDHLPAPHVHGARFDTRYKLYGRRNHLVLLTRHEGFLAPRSRRWVASQLGAVAGAGDLRRKLERFGVTVLGVSWGLAAAPRQAGWRAADPVLNTPKAHAIRRHLTANAHDAL